jgi:hypothetical protein
MPVIGVVSGQSSDAEARNTAAFRKALNVFKPALAARRRST